MKRDRYNSYFDSNNVPKKVRAYDNGGKSFDRYTIVFTGNYRGLDFLYLRCSEHPSHPQGFGQHGSSNELIDRPTYSHLGKKIKFESLPPDVQKLVVESYKSLWGIQFLKGERID